MTVTQGYRKMKHTHEKINHTEETGDHVRLHSLSPRDAPGAREQLKCLLEAPATSVVRNQVEAARLGPAHAEGFAPSSPAAWPGGRHTSFP